MLCLFLLSWVVICIVGIVICGKTRSLTKKANMLLYGSKKPTDTPTEFGKKFLEENAAYEKSVTQYKEYIKQLKKYMYEKSISESGYDYNSKWAKLSYWTSTHKAATFIIALAVIAIIAVIVIIPAML